jgi:hypothetical protein
MSARAAKLPLLSPSLTTAAADALPAGVPVIGGGPVATLFPGAAPAGQSGLFDLFRTESWLVGRAAAPVDDDLAAAVNRLYGELLLIAHGRHLCRIWNYVPRINAVGADGLENYRAFSAGRSLAFERHFGRGFKRRLSASSAVGTTGERVEVVFAASSAVPRHFENPAQVPAYDYPPEHGPRPPSFSRATVVSTGDRADVFIAGTSAIKGHETLAPGDTRAQLEITVDNLRLVSRVTGLGDDLGAGRCAARHLKIYLRDAADYPAVAAAFAGALGRPGDAVSYLRADICRAALNVEIEAAVLGAALAG